ncbi:MAG: hypothetical protein ACFFF4_06645 [Candidatus Thorarchaeota archaeon]
MSDKEEMWKEEFASLAKEDFENACDSKKKHRSTFILGILCIIYIFMIGGASIVTIIAGTLPNVYWDSPFLIQEILFFGVLFVLLACLFFLEGNEKI